MLRRVPRRSSLDAILRKKVETIRWSKRSPLSAHRWLRTHTATAAGEAWLHTIRGYSLGMIGNPASMTNCLILSCSTWSIMYSVASSRPLAAASITRTRQGAVVGWLKRHRYLIKIKATVTNPIWFEVEFLVRSAPSKEAEEDRPLEWLEPRSARRGATG